MDAFIEKFAAFIEKVKDDPALSELFRIAANELHAELNPAPAEQVEQAEPPASVEQVEQVEPPAV